MLPINFHKTFIPERRLIGALLHFAALGKQGTYQEIAAETGIPMGASSGKVPAIIDYARGMGLVELGDGPSAAIKRPVLTPFGRSIYLTDKYLGEEMTQWLAHINLCRNDIGAETWNAVFATSRRTLGSSFSRQQLDDYLIRVYGPGNDRIGPMIRTYSDDAALKRGGAISSEGDLMLRRKAPILDSYATPYSAIVLTFMECYFPGQAQVTFSDFNERTSWFDICLWNAAEIERVFAIVDLKAFVSIDRQMQPWMLEARASSSDVWERIFEDMV